MSTSLIFYGTSAAIPSLNRGFSCIGISDGNNGSVLFDCGDGALHNIMKFGLDVNSIKGIALSHYHSDHLSGLTQVIETMGIRKRETQLPVFGPPGLKEYFSTVQKITNVASKRNFELRITEVEPGRIFRVGDYPVESFKMDHTIPCNGYRVTVSNNKILSYTGDTMPCEALKDLGNNADVLVHEATFLHKDLERSVPPKHSTVLQAASVAKESGAKKLILTHVSDVNETQELMMKEAKPEFPNVTVAYDGYRSQI